MLVTSWDPVLIAVSFFVAFIASFTALDIAGRVAISQGRAALYWLLGGGTAMGIGIWAMHFIGMLAMMLPMEMHYDLALTGASLISAIVASILALWQVCRSELTPARLMRGSLLLASGVAAMHFIGMLALMITPAIQWRPGLVALSLVIALLASGSAMWLAFHLRRGERGLLARRALASIILGIAVAGMHYTGMAAAQFADGSEMFTTGVSEHGLAVWVTAITLAILGITLLVSMLEAQIRTSRLTARLAHANHELEQLATHDPLTQLPNRIQLEKRLDLAIRQATQRNSHFALMLMDIDGFKAVNDAYGHHVGDRLLTCVAERLLSRLNVRHTLARLGGDEFVLLLEDAGADDAAQLAATLVRAIEEPFIMARYHVSVSLSIGIALFPNDGIEQHDLMLNADMAMYHTKHSGRNGWHFFEPSMGTLSQHQLQLANDLWTALEHDELRLFYQPKFSAADGALLGFEALLRWQHPQHGLLTPEMFLPRAEKTGFIISIGNWVINEACRQLQSWRQQGHQQWTVSVNLSELQFAQRELIFTVQHALQHYQLPASSLMLEVTEAIAMRDPEFSQHIIAALAELGIRISIDNFGIGYANLLHLQRLAASELKIDRTFINKLKLGSDDSTIITAMVAMAQRLNLRIVAEGVETLEQQQLLTGLGFDTLQGYLLGKPMPADQVGELQFISEAAPPPDVDSQQPLASA
ncbi:diguanylate cyclase (GGDEF)-like protein [Erwinia toletana]|uniref:Diguanylate cyclase (GGDEF)-like protein n=1 Tax=Winslowiella toletana TaxID=92490 RepID=A0ABS4P6J9_9GAMM|nr:bifunctional diguanylate cyclase/phosphodiesterase [Winslowiella toletana]MBP2168274.1 diguanylate cyclase (GGDEF)-like protein [Winslowiella toletana]